MAVTRRSANATLANFPFWADRRVSDRKLVGLQVRGPMGLQCCAWNVRVGRVGSLLDEWRKRPRLGRIQADHEIDASIVTMDRNRRVRVPQHELTRTQTRKSESSSCAE